MLPDGPNEAAGEDVLVDASGGDHRDAAYACADLRVRVRAGQQDAGPRHGHHPVPGDDLVLPLVHSLRAQRCQELLRVVYRLEVVEWLFII